jgi:hypothetical protein
MNISFKNWFLSEEKSIGSDGGNSHPTQSAQAAVKVAQQYLGTKSNVPQITRLSKDSASNSTANAVKIGAEAIGNAPDTIANKTDSLQVAQAIRSQVQKTGFMRKKMKKK